MKINQEQWQELKNIAIDLANSDKYDVFIDKSEIASKILSIIGYDYQEGTQA